MSRDERRARHERMLRALDIHDVHAWQARFLTELQACARRRVARARHGAQAAGERSGAVTIH